MLAFTPDRGDPLAAGADLGHRDVPRADGQAHRPVGPPGRLSLLESGRVRGGRPRRHRRRLAPRHPRLHQRAARAPDRRRDQQGRPRPTRTSRLHRRGPDRRSALARPRRPGWCCPAPPGGSCPGRGGGMADTGHSKCSGRKVVRVRVPPSAPSTASPRRSAGPNRRVDVPKRAGNSPRIGCPREHRREHDPQPGTVTSPAPTRPPRLPDARTPPPRRRPHPHRHRRGRGADPPRPRGDAGRGGLRRRRPGRRTASRPSSSPRSSGPTWSSSTSRCRSSTGIAPPSRSARASGSPRSSCSPRSRQRELVERARDAGAMAYLVKPFTADRPACRPSRSPVALAAELKALEAEVADLGERLETRKAVDRAKGVLMTQLELSEPEAFRWIQKTAMDRRLGMREVAEAVINGLPACTDRRLTAARSSGARPSGHDTVTIRRVAVREPRPHGLVFGLVSRSGQPLDVRGDRVTSGGHPCVLPSSSACRSRSQHLPSAPVAPRAATPRPAAAPAAPQLRPEDRLLRCPHRRDANLGINIQNGVKLALDEYNKKHADCKVKLEQLRLPGRPDPGPGPGQEGDRRQDRRRHRRPGVLR